ncbi:MAG: bifunctional nicotinamidase/pyrazinamidase [Parachlamydiaceae bacterium]
MPIEHSTLRVINPRPEDRLPIQVNRAEMLYERGFGMRYQSESALRLFKSAGIAAAAIPFSDSHELFLRSVKVLSKGVLFGVVKLAFSALADPIKLVAESFEHKRHPEGRTALLIIDAQKDFTKEGRQTIDGIEYFYAAGGLGVDKGYEIVPVINQLIRCLPEGSLIAASLDWHPIKHKGFASSTPGFCPHETIMLAGLEQELWQDHCIQGSEGAKLLPGLLTDRINYIVKKGTCLFVDSYSAFYDNGGKNPTNLHDYLQGKNVKRLLITGLATDYCVKFTAIDGKKLGYDVTVIEDACRGIDFENSVALAIEEMKQAGIKIMQSTDLL